MGSFRKSSARVSRLRMEYLAGALDEAHVAKNPQTQLTRWIDAAIESELVEPHAMTLATVDAQKRPHARIVLLRGIERQGLIFYTNYQSAKGEEISANANAALVFFWPELERQVRVEGTLKKLSAARSTRYFSTRPRANQIGAWASKQSQVVAGRSALDAAFAAAAAEFDGTKVPRPPHWGGYILSPVRYEFWQGQRSRLHDRICYRRARDASWKIERLFP